MGNAQHRAVAGNGRPFSMSDVPPVPSAAMAHVVCHLIDRGQGLALLKGLDAGQLADVEAMLWQHFYEDAETRLAVALRVRALLAVFQHQRLRNLLLDRGFKVMAAAAGIAASQRLNTRFGFVPQRVLAALDAATAPAAGLAVPNQNLSIAA
jgi:hypothetical protein